MGVFFPILETALLFFPCLCLVSRGSDFTAGLDSRDQLKVCFGEPGRAFSARPGSQR